MFYVIKRVFREILHINTIRNRRKSKNYSTQNYQSNYKILSDMGINYNSYIKRMGCEQVHIALFKKNYS